MLLSLDRIEIESAGSDPLQLAQALLKQLPDLDGRVPISEVALALDIEEVCEAPLVSLEACLQCDRLKSRGQIVVNANSTARRRRYSIGHELGHFLNERHRPSAGGQMNCTVGDMRSAALRAHHQQQEREANVFAIEVLAPRHLLADHLQRAPNLEHALAISERFDISRAAAIRRYIDLHRNRMAAVFSRNGRILYIDRPEGFPITSVWANDPLPEASDPPRERPDLTGLERVTAAAWLRSPRGMGLLAQTLFQRDGHAVTLLLAEGEPREPQLPHLRRMP